MTKTVTLRFHTDDEALIHNLVMAWLDDEPVVIETGGGRDTVTLSYVKEREDA